MRVWSSGWALAFQANEGSSILPARSTYIQEDDMYKNAVKYKGVMLAPNSKAFELYHNAKDPQKSKKELDALMKRLEQEDKQRVGVV